jgi:hypothetical protein
MFFGQFLNPPIFIVLVRLGGVYGRAFLIYALICAAIAAGAAAHAALARTTSAKLGAPA